MDWYTSRVRAIPTSRSAEEPESLFISSSICPLLKYPLKRYSLPCHVDEKIELERIRTLPVPPWKPLILTDPLTQRDFAHVIGYREIYLKRQHVEWLRAEAESVLPPSKYFCWDEKESDPSGFQNNNEVLVQRRSSFSHLLAPGGGGKRSSKKLHKSGKGSVKEDQKSRKIEHSEHRSEKSGKGGSKSEKGGSRSKRTDGTSRRDETKEADMAAESKKADKRMQKKRLWQQRRASEKKKRALERPMGGGGEEEEEKEAQNGDEGTIRPEEEENIAAPFVDQEINDDITEAAARALEKQVEEELTQVGETRTATISVDPTIIERTELEADFLQEDVPETKETDEDMIFEVKTTTAPDVIVLTPGEDHVLTNWAEEKDSEWLQLSGSNSLEKEDRQEADRLVKQKPNWMHHGISYESQHLVSEMKPFFLFASFLGRSPYAIQANHRQRIVEFFLSRVKEYIFFITSVILWIMFVLIIQAAIDVLILGGDDLYSKYENVELKKYIVLIIFYVGELGVVAIWSVLLILNYDHRITHYMNILSVSLTEMETNAGEGLQSIAYYHIFFYVVYSLLVIISFAVQIPKNVYGSFGVLTALMIRNFVPHVLESDSAQYLMILRIVGLLIHMYVSYCLRVTFTLVHVLSTVLKNSSQMWNLKFALRMGQIPVGESGYLRQLRIRQTMVKMWLHHRLLSGLCAQLGYIFAVPLIIYLTVQLFNAVWILVYLFGKAYETEVTREAYLKIARFKHSQDFMPSLIDNICSALFVLLYLVVCFVVNAEVLASASKAFRDGFEFVRRKGLILSLSSRERRIIQSLQWSFSAANPQEINLMGLVTVSRETSISFLSTALLLWSLIIQLQAEAKAVIVVFTPNCLQKPNGNFEPYITGYIHSLELPQRCRKKIWLLESQLGKSVETITGTMKRNTTVDLNASHINRRRRSLSNATYTEEEISIMDQKQDPSPEKPRYHWMSGTTFRHTEYVDGNCLNPVRNPMSTRKRLENYYRHFHESCYSRQLNMTLIVPKLFGLRKKVWLGRKALDCGAFPFPAFPFGMYNRDCSGKRFGHIYDDCGWRKTYVDDIMFASYNASAIGNEDASRSRSMTEVVPVHVSIPDGSGRVLRCWNIFTELQRCKRIVELNLQSLLCAPMFRPNQMMSHLRAGQEVPLLATCFFGAGVYSPNT